MQILQDFHDLLVGGLKSTWKIDVKVVDILKMQWSRVFLLSCHALSTSKKIMEGKKEAWLFWQSI